MRYEVALDDRLVRAELTEHGKRVPAAATPVAGTGIVGRRQ